VYERCRNKRAGVEKLIDAAADDRPSGTVVVSVTAGTDGVIDEEGVEWIHAGGGIWHSGGPHRGIRAPHEGEKELSPNHATGFISAGWIIRIKLLGKRLLIKNARLLTINPLRQASF
jgi:hypothetical protein